MIVLDFSPQTHYKQYVKEYEPDSYQHFIWLQSIVYKMYIYFKYVTEVTKTTHVKKRKRKRKRKREEDQQQPNVKKRKIKQTREKKSRKRKRDEM